MPANSTPSVTRRQFLLTSGALGGGALLSAGPPRPLLAEEVDDLVSLHVGKGPILWEKVQIGLVPPVAENAASVRMPVTVDHPMEADLHITHLAIFVDNNPSPFSARFDFTPQVPRVEVELRIKMVKKSRIRAIATNNRGQIFGTAVEVDIAGGNCVG